MRFANSLRFRLGSQLNQWSKLCAPTGTTRSCGILCSRTASSTCISFQTMVSVGTSRIRPLLREVVPARDHEDGRHSQLRRCPHVIAFDETRARRAVIREQHPDYVP